MKKTEKVETVKKFADGWKFLDPSSGSWTGSYASRVVARAARAAAVSGQPLSDAPNLSAEKVVDSADAARVDSLVLSETPGDDVAHIEEDEKTMANISLTLDPKQRKSTSVVYKLPDGMRGSVRIAKTAFPNGTPPTSLNLQGDAFAEPKQALTPEQRKQARKNAPKLTAAQKLQKLQERAAKLQAKIAAEANQPAAAGA